MPDLIRLARALVLFAFFVLQIAARADDPVAKPDPLYSAIDAAIAKGQILKTKMIGSGFNKSSFSETPRDGGLLVGFDVGLGKWLDTENIYALRPVYRTAKGEAAYGEHGLFPDRAEEKGAKSKVLRTLKVRAKPGYAVGGLKMRSGLNIDGMSVRFMRIKDGWLDPSDAYITEWLGNRFGGSEASIGSDGGPVVGLFGNEDADHIIALGLIYLSRSSRAVDEAPQPPIGNKVPAEKPPAAGPKSKQLRPAEDAKDDQPAKEKKPATEPAAAAETDPLTWVLPIAGALAVIMIVVTCCLLLMRPAKPQKK
jgi:hypothetical protein